MQLFWTIVKLAFVSLRANKLRSFLAMLGIVIGTGAVIAMSALGAGARNQVMQRITAMGTNLLIIRPGGFTREGVRIGTRESLKLADAEDIVARIDGIEAVSPVVFGRGQVKYFNKNQNTSITGASLTYLEMRNFICSNGRTFTDNEEETGAKVAILGSALAETLFTTNNPVGETIRIKNINFRVIGVLKPKGDQGWFNPDDMVVIPYITAMKHVTGQNYLNEIDVKLKNNTDGNIVVEKITALLRHRHRIREGDESDFTVRNQAEMIEMASDVTRTFTILLGGIAAISLLVGGIGIMNIMLVNVTERTREIGIRKAVGARDRDILRQFLIESVLVCGVGGFLGIGLGFAGAEAFNRFSEYRASVEFYSIIIAFLSAGSVGIFFGYYPARRAARLNPIEALRYE